MIIPYFSLKAFLEGSNKGIKECVRVPLIVRMGDGEVLALDGVLVLVEPVHGVPPSLTKFAH